MKRFQKVFATVFTEDNHHKVMLPSGVVLPHIVETVTADGVSHATCKVEMVCNVVATKEDALKEYAKTE